MNTSPAATPEPRAEAFESISEAAHQSKAEIDRLVELLDTSSPATPPAGLRIVEDLVGRARASGLRVTCQFSGDSDDLSELAAESVYRVVQEAVTNAMKHAPGAPIDIAVVGHAGTVEVRVVNQPAHSRRSGLEEAGGGHGAGRHEGACRGGGWDVQCRPDPGAGMGSRRPPPPPPPGQGGSGPTTSAPLEVAPGEMSVLIADDQRLVRAGFGVILDKEPDITVVGEAGDGLEAIQLARSLSPTVVLMDIRMPNMDGLAAARVILAETKSRVLMLTTFDSDEYVYAALRAGASGFLLKDAPSEQLVAAVRVVAGGDALIDPSITRRLIQQFVTATRPRTEQPSQLASLTPRELEVLRLVAQGLSNAEIAARLVVEESTAKTHVARILMKLGLHDRVQAVVMAYECGFVVPDTGSPDI